MMNISQNSQNNTMRYPGHSTEDYKIRKAFSAGVPNITCSENFTRTLFYKVHHTLAWIKFLRRLFLRTFSDFSYVYKQHLRSAFLFETTRLRCFLPQSFFGKKINPKLETNKFVFSLERAFPLRLLHWRKISKGS